MHGCMGLNVLRVSDPRCATDKGAGMRCVGDARLATIPHGKARCVGDAWGVDPHAAMHGVKGAQASRGASEMRDTPAVMS